MSHPEISACLEVPSDASLLSILHSSDDLTVLGSRKRARLEETARLVRENPHGDRFNTGYRDANNDIIHCGMFMENRYIHQRWFIYIPLLFYLLYPVCIVCCTY